MYERSRSRRACAHFPQTLFPALMVALAMVSGAALAPRPVAGAEADASAEGARPDYGVDSGLPPVASAPRRRELPVADVAASVTVIERSEIERRQLRSLPDLLRDVPGLHVVRSGGIGKQTSIFTRGTESNHTLVLLDGIEISDPSAPSGVFNTADFLLENVERVEILRGPQSALYGSDAIGGVIQIVTRKGRGEPRVNGWAEYGAFNTTQHGLGLTGGGENLDYSLDYTGLHTRGFTALDEDLGGHERDGYDNRTLSGRVGLSPGGGARLDLIGRFIDSANELDPFEEDRDSRDSTRQLFLRAEARLEIGRLEPRLGVSFTDVDRKATNDADPSDPFSSFAASSFDGTRLKLDLQNDWVLGEGWVLTIGAETERETFDSSSIFVASFGTTLGDAHASVRTTSGYGQLAFRLFEGLDGVVGGRLEHHDEFGSELTYRVALGYVHPPTGTRVYGNLATGFKAPGLNELFDRLLSLSGSSSFPIFSGNPDLDPERSRGWEIGVEQPFLDGQLRIGTAYFQNRIRDLIDSTANFDSVVNVGRARTDGFESFLSLSLSPRLAMRLDHTYTMAEDRDTGEDLLRRPSHRFSAKLELRPVDELTLSLVSRYVGHRKDVGNVSLGGYTVTDVAATYRLDRGITLLGRIDNLFDKDYLDPDRFERTGFSGYFGVRLAY